MIDDRLLRTGLEFAVDAAAAGRVRVPDGLRAVIRKQRLDAGALERVRRIVEEDVAFREQVAALASADLVDEPALLWLRRPAGWQERLDELTANVDGDDRRLRRLVGRLRRAEQRISELEADNERLRRRAATAGDGAAELQAEVARLAGALAQAQAAARHTAHEAAQARERAVQARAAERTAVQRAREAERARQDTLPEALAEAGALLERLGGALSRARAAAAPQRPRPPKASPVKRRTPLALPGGVSAESVEAGEHLLRWPGVLVLIDGYNVAMLGWPDEPLARQRGRLLESVETLAVRTRADITVVFDGADVSGASAPRRRALRVEYSSPGVLADDVIRQRVLGLPTSSAVVVVTDDRAVRDDVHRAGANLLSSATLLRMACR